MTAEGGLGESDKRQKDKSGTMEGSIGDREKGEGDMHGTIKRMGFTNSVGNNQNSLKNW